MTNKIKVNLNSLYLQNKEKISKHDFCWLTSEVLECSLTNIPPEIQQKQAHRIQNLINQRTKGIPLQYIANSAYFMDLKLYVDKNVLIPRPETEVLVNRILSDSTKVSHVIEIGTGSGAIALQLKYSRPQWKIYASDISKEAIAVAKKNAKKLNMQINFQIGHLMEPWENLDAEIVVANLPYLDPKKDFISEETWIHEPHLALIPLRKQKNIDLASSLANELIETCFRIHSKCQYPKKIFLELSPRVAYNLLRKWKSKFRKVWRFSDLNKRNRFLVLEF